MRTAIALLLLVILGFVLVRHARGATVVNLQTCAVAPTTGGLVGCPTAQVLLEPVAPNTLVRSIVNGVQGWRPFRTLTLVDSVVAAPDYGWHVLSTITPALQPTTLVAPPVSPPPATPPAVSVWVPLNWTCTTANNVATCTAPVPP